MIIKFYDCEKYIKEVTLGSVVFVTDLHDKSDWRKYTPAHVLGFAYNNVDEIILRLDVCGVVKEMYPGNVCWSA